MPRPVPHIVVDASFLILLLALWTSMAYAQSEPPQRPGGSPRAGPPPEAIEACKSLASGKACSMTLQSRTVRGTCWAPEGKPLACRPADAPPPVKE